MKYIPVMAAAVSVWVGAGESDVSPVKSTLQAAKILEIVMANGSWCFVFFRLTKVAT